MTGAQQDKLIASKIGIGYEASEDETMFSVKMKYILCFGNLERIAANPVDHVSPHRHAASLLVILTKDVTWPKEKQVFEHSTPVKSPEGGGQQRKAHKRVPVISLFHPEPAPAWSALIVIEGD